MIMSESEPEKEIIPKREMLISPLRNWDENSTELLAEYYEGLEMGDGATREGRFRIGEEMIRVYMEAGHYDEASSTAEAIGLHLTRSFGGRAKHTLSACPQRRRMLAAVPGTS